MDSGVQCNKEMVDLLLRLKKHLKTRYQTALSMSDNNLMEQLLKFAKVKDENLQEMMQNLMEMAGDEWIARYLEAAHGIKPSPSKKSLTGILRDRFLSDTAIKSANYPLEANLDSESEFQGKDRLYRGRPVYG